MEEGKKDRRPSAAMSTSSQHVVGSVTAIGHPTEKVVIGAGQVSDEAWLETLGHEQVMKRNFNLWSLLGMCFCVSSTWEAIVGVMAQALTSGGSSSVIWGFVAAAVGALFQALALSEYASIIPTAGGQYHWTAALAPKEYRPVLSWYAGWITVAAWILTTTGAIFSTAMQITAYAILCNPEYPYERWHSSLVFILLIIIFTLMNVFGTRSLHWLNISGIVVHLSGYFAVMISLLVLAKSKHTAEYVFTNFQNNSGWSSDGVAWSIGLMSSALGFIGFDSASHMAEEMKHASRDLPRSMWGSIAVSGITTFPFMVVIMLCIGNVDDVINTDIGRISPLTQLFYNLTGSPAAAVGLVSFTTVLGIVSGPSCISSSSRVVFAFARDNGLPAFLSKIHPRSEVPLNAILVTSAISGSLGLIYIGNSTAYYSIGSSVSVLLMASYGLPIAVNMLWGIRYHKMIPGAFSLGRWSLPVNVIALCWTVYAFVFMMFPTLMPVTKENMNYCVVVFGGVIIASTVMWFLRGRKVFTGPFRDM